MKIPETNPLTACLISAAHGGGCWILARYAFGADVKSATVIALFMTAIMFGMLIMED